MGPRGDDGVISKHREMSNGHVIIVPLSEPSPPLPLPRRQEERVWGDAARMRSVTLLQRDFCQ